MAKYEKKKKISAAKELTKKESSSSEKNERLKSEKKPYNENSLWNMSAPYLFAFLAMFLIITFLFKDKMNVVGKIADAMFGLFGLAMWLIPFATLLIAVRWKTDAPKGLIKFRVLCLAAGILFLSGFIALIMSPTVEIDGMTYTLNNYKEKYNILTFLFTAGSKLSGGGVFGGFICIGLTALCGKIGCGIITGCISVVSIFLIFGITLGDIARFIRTKVGELSDDVSAAQAQRHEEIAQRRELSLQNKKQKSDKRRSSSVGELEIEDNDDDKDIELEPEKNKKTRREEKKKEKDFLSDFFSPDNEKPLERVPDNELEPEKTGFENAVIRPDMSAFEDAKAEKQAENGSIDDIFCEDAVIAGAGETISAKDIAAATTETAESEAFKDGEELNAEESGEDGENSETSGEDDVPFDFDSETDIIENDVPSPEEIYEFPPVDLLPGNPNPSVFKVTEELTETAKTLVSTLANFNVRTKVMNISCGPTVTRYELKPEVGVKVRSIQNLADDIALHLRASSVRIEAPIPGKDAVGIEIPNKTVSTVYIKELIDREEFRNLPSKLSVALGMDVSGTPVYMDIAKMPHLLIAGATGMGKSVCINSFIVSILYKARPDEVKLILIDPKKVEFAMYDSIPHLLVPVVTDPKKAAGSLAWAVNEMEHRFNLIEAAKCRDIKSYNAVCERDSRFKKMCQIVIIIDELADLMMTARDEVETSICRLAQKARAAGMHLIIGTQRPSVDVITGVIKANVPSRIAFTVASLVDSRTILDVGGAENLVGKGDMLFAPVGCMKPTRVQGSFVGSDSVIEEITNFLKGSGTPVYDDDIQNAIELEAMRCTEKKKGKNSDASETYVGSTDGFERDEMMLPALELGVDMGQISTSLVQRKLSLGYARAARIVDMLSDMGFVGPFEGSKPRKVLITREEFHEIKMKNGNINESNE